ncbi:glycosyltransferase [Oscillospiraceae bacterium OttesenSCG-928-F05]|nr:glycosyltransferase [Oscillospiraceae bacterium OttesenSCG-928-F05]
MKTSAKRAARRSGAPGGPKTTLREAVKNRFWIILNTALTAVYLWWRLFYTLPLEHGPVAIVVGVALFIIELMGAFEALVHYFNMHRVENHPVPDVPHALFPDVDIFIATYSEPRELLYKTINGCLHLDYPNRSKVHIHLCDDGRRAEMRELAASCGIGYITREGNKGAKAGNLNNALSVTTAPLIVTLDADMIPKSDMLMRMVPYFVAAELENAEREEDDKVRMGFVQSPQSFYNPDLFQFNLFSEGKIPNEQDYFYKDIQVSRNRSNSVIYGGSNTMLSRAAIDDIGGFYTDAITEDFATGILIQQKGYICYGINEVLASGLSATDLDSLIKQRIRWARGCISTGRKLHILLTPKLTLAQKANYWASIWYWYAPFKRLVYILSPVLFAVFGYVVVKCTLREVLIFWLPMYVTSNIALRMLSRNIRTTKWTSIYETVLFPFMLFPVLFESLGMTLKTFSVTKKDGPLGSSRSLTHLVPFVLLIALVLLGIVNCVGMIFESGSMSPIVVLFWLLMNLFNLVMSLFFILGRRFFRVSERVLAKIDCEILTEANAPLNCQTIDFSETGVAVFLQEPTDIDEKETVTLRLKTDRYASQLEAKVVHVGPLRGGWKYAFEVESYCDTFDDYLQIMYDRVPTLPTNLSNAPSSFDDLRMNITRRATGVYYQNRRYPRIPVNETVPTDGGDPAEVINFNYKFVLLGKGEGREALVLLPEEGLQIACLFDRDIMDGSRLYTVTNYGVLHEDAVMRGKLRTWVLRLLRSEGEKEERRMSARPKDSLVDDMLGGEKEGGR